MGNVTDIANRQAVSVQPSMRLPASQRERDITDLVPVSRAEFVPVIGPLLQLVAPSGMTSEAQEAWLEAAFKALDGIPIALLKRGVEAATAKADHPSKIVPTILAAIKDDWAWRREYRAPKPVTVWEPDHRRVPEAERQEVAAMFDQLLSNLGSSEDKPA